MGWNVKRRFLDAVCALALALALVPLMARADVLTLSQRLDDFEQLVSWVRNDYGPLRFKEEKLGFHFEEVTAAYRKSVAAPMADDDFRYLLAKYVAEFRDAHFSLRYPTAATASLGFTTDLVGDKVVFDTVDRKALPEAQFPFERGDEVVALDGVPALEASREVSSYLNVSFEPTGLRVGVFYLGLRRASRMPLPSGLSLVTVRSRKTGDTRTVSLKWTIDKGTQLRSKRSDPLLPKGPVGLADMCSEQSRIAPPSAAKFFEGVPFTAFTFATPKGQVGFIRLPHYYPRNLAGDEIAQEHFDQYERVLAEYERTTVGLIIDQDFNCGGSVVYLHRLFSVFQPRPFAPIGFSFRASQTQVEGLRRQLEKFTPADNGYAEFRDVIDEIERSWKAGREMTPVLPMRGFMEFKLNLPGGNRIEPNEVQYTKPVIVLINEMSGSGGDVFPSMMKDSGRAKLMGARTMGAGGHMWDDPPLRLPHSKGNISLTRSLIYRLNGSLIENAGVEPDYPYEVTMDDYLGGYSNYLKKATEHLLEQIDANGGR
jgi:hypothetical protein